MILYCFIQSVNQKKASAFRLIQYGRRSLKQALCMKIPLTRLQQQRQLRGIWNQKILWIGLYAVMLALARLKSPCALHLKLLLIINRLQFLCQQLYLLNSITILLKTGLLPGLRKLTTFQGLKPRRNRRKYSKSLSQAKSILL